MSFAVISASLRSGSHSRILASAAVSSLQEMGEDCEFVDMQQFPLPLCDGESAYEDPGVETLSQLLSRHDRAILATPIYNYDANAVLKNLIELTGSQWENKIVGFLCAAGGTSSYMSIMALANSLMLDFRCWVVPRFVYATREAFGEGKITDAKVGARVEELCKALVAVRIGG